MRTIMALLSSIALLTSLTGCASAPSAPAGGPPIPPSAITTVLDKAGSFLMMAEDSSGGLWIAYPAGLKHFDGKAWKDISKANGLASQKITCMIIDRRDNVWVGTGTNWDFSGDGIFRWDGKAWTRYTTRDGLSSNTVLTLYEDHAGNIWAGALNGICKFDGKVWTSITKETGRWLPRQVLDDGKGRIWIGDFTGVTKIEGGKATKMTEVPTFSMAVDSKGNLYCAHYLAQYSKYDGSQFVTASLVKGISKNLLPSPGETRAVVMVTKKDIVWYASRLPVTNVLTAEAGTFKYEKGAWTQIGTKDGLPWPRVVYGIKEDSRGNIWVLTAWGVCRFDGKSWLSLEGGASNFIFADSKGNIWLNNKGLVKISPGF
ncbi:MAG: two-component regulator propeller domain-containing protein [Spirochaetia bacterium]